MNIRQALIVLASLLGGCTSLPDAPIDRPVNWETHKKSISDIKHWYLSGRLAIKNGNESWNVKLYWHQSNAKYHILLSGPFGAGSVRLKGDPHSVTMTDSDNKSHLAWDASTLLYQQTGIRIPVKELRYWVLGLPSPNMTSQPEFDAYGRIKIMRQEGWSINMKRYTQLNGEQLPQKIFMLGHDLDVRLVIDEWKLGTLPKDNPLAEDSPV